MLVDRNFVSGICKLKPKNLKILITQFYLLKKLNDRRFVQLHGDNCCSVGQQPEQEVQVQVVFGCLSIKALALALPSFDIVGVDGTCSTTEPDIQLSLTNRAMLEGHWRTSTLGVACVRCQHPHSSSVHCHCQRLSCSRGSCVEHSAG